MQDTGIIENVYEELCSYENLETAFNRARRGKTLKDYVIEFEAKLKENLLQLRTELLLQTYQPQPLKTFILRDPKTRKISKSAFRDRVVHHAICNIIEPVFDKRFIYDSFANRLRKGTLNAVKRFDEFKRKVSQNNTIRCYVLKADVKSYFDTVNHQILLQILEKRIKDEKLMWLIRKILANHKGEEANKGMPLGNLTSQFFANVYLNELDQFVKHKLRVKYYIRYVDDFAILHQSRKVLEEYKDKIDQFLREKLDLKLHPDKSQVLKLEKGIGFLGFRVFYHHKLLVQKNLRKFEKRFKQMKQDYKEQLLDQEKLIAKFEGWLAYVNHANTYKYRIRLTKMLAHTLTFEPATQANYSKKHEKFMRKAETSKLQFSTQKTLHLFRKGLSVKEIAKTRELKESTVWEHLTKLIQHNQLQLQKVLPEDKIYKIKSKIHTPEDRLKCQKR